MKNKVLLVSPYSRKKIGGIGTWTKNILDYNTKYGKFDIAFLNTAFGFKPNLEQKSWHRLFYGIVDSILVIFLLFIKIIQKKPNTIHYTSSSSFALFKDYIAIYVAKLFKIKFVIHWRFGRIPALSEKNNWEWKMLKKVIKAANVSIVIDKASLFCLKNKGFDNVVFIPNPISESLKERAESINFENKEITIGSFVFVGHIVPSKGVYELVKACSEVKGVKQLILIGPVNETVKNDLRLIASNRNNGDWLLWKGEIPREEVFNYLVSANALCLPSYTEGFPNVVLEAMSLGCPVIATKVGAIENMMECGGNERAGICIEPKSTNQIIHAIEYCISNYMEIRMLGKNGNAQVLLEYTLEKIFGQYEEIW